MTNEKIKEVLENIQKAFFDEDRYELRKSIDDIVDQNQKFLGDFFNYLMVDKLATPPIFYLVVSPYDLISNKGPQHALVWQGGELLLNTDYTDYAAMRTGAMDTIAMKSCKVDSLKHKKILLFGTGRTAKWSLQVLKAVYEDLNEIYYINSTDSKSEEFEAYALELAVNALVGTKEELESYDIILCHTNAKEPVLSKNDMQKIKKGAIITTFIASTEHGEVADEFYSEEANVVLDWEKNIKIAKDISRSKIPATDIIFLQDLLSVGETAKKTLDKEKKYTIFRFVGTPMQNLGVLRTLVKTK